MTGTDQTGHRIRFGDLREFTPAELPPAHSRSVVLDFSETTEASADGVLPLVATADRLRGAALRVSVVLPGSDELKHRFLQHNWAHLLEPARFRESAHATAARRFRSFEEQQQTVNDFARGVLQSVAISREVLNGLVWAVNEITDNVLTHAESADGGLFQFDATGERVVVEVADAGIGVLASLRPSHPDLTTDADALLDAVKAGVSRDRELGQGNGLAGALQIATRSGGSLNLRSGRARLEARTDVVARNHAGPEYSGVSVRIEVSSTKAFSVAEALAFDGEPHPLEDTIELLYGADDGRTLVLRLSDEAVGFGSREAGRQLRLKCRNLLDAHPGTPLVVDWSGARFVSSGFSDELMGKLFVELGPLAFGATVRNTKMEPMVRGLVDKAIMQRAAQEVTGLSAPLKVAEDDRGDFGGGG